MAPSGPLWLAPEVRVTFGGRRVPHDDASSVRFTEVPEAEPPEAARPVGAIGLAGHERRPDGPQHARRPREGRYRAGGHAPAWRRVVPGGAECHRCLPAPPPPLLPRSRPSSPPQRRPPTLPCTPPPPLPVRCGCPMPRRPHGGSDSPQPHTRARPDDTLGRREQYLQLDGCSWVFLHKSDGASWSSAQAVRKLCGMCTCTVCDVQKDISYQ